ncbi:hypothetical protein [Campylobacter phage CJLB-12]|nr:hypothetical protein [Campylobacter phage CJLB-12]
MQKSFLNSFKCFFLHNKKIKVDFNRVFEWL